MIRILMWAKFNTGWEYVGDYPPYGDVLAHVMTAFRFAEIETQREFYWKLRPESPCL